MFDISLFSNHSPSEWFSRHKNRHTLVWCMSVCVWGIYRMLPHPSAALLMQVTAFRLRG